MLIPARTRLACRILHYLATCPVGVAKQVDIARAVCAPKSYTGKVARELLFAGFVKSVRGYHGGYALALPASSIRLGDVAEFIEDTRTWRSRLHTETPFMESVLCDARRAFLDVMNECSMANFCAEAGSNVGKSAARKSGHKSSEGRGGSVNAPSAKFAVASSAQA